MRPSLVGHLTDLAAVVAIGTNDFVPLVIDAVGATDTVLVLPLGALILATPSIARTEIPLLRQELRRGNSTFAAVRRALAGAVVLAIVFTLMRLPLWLAFRSGSPWLLGWLALLAEQAWRPVVGQVGGRFLRGAPLTDASRTAAVEYVLAAAGLRGYRVLVLRQKAVKRLGAWVQGFPSRRILLSASLAARPVHEVEAAVAHEAAHVRRHHAWLSGLAGVAVAAAQIAAIRFAWPARGVFDVDSPGDPAAIVFIELCLVATGAPLEVFDAWLSRARERHADLWVTRWARSPLALAPLLKELALSRGDDPSPARLAYLQLSHPPVAERIELLERWVQDVVPQNEDGDPVGRD